MIHLTHFNALGHFLAFLFKIKEGNCYSILFNWKLYVKVFVCVPMNAVAVFIEREQHEFFSLKYFEIIYTNARHFKSVLR